MPRRWFKPFLVALLTAAPALAQDKDEAARPRMVAVRGRVINAEGQPVAGAKVGTSWMYGPGSPEPSIYQPALTDAEGRFTQEVAVWPKHPSAVVALGDDTKLGGFAVIAAGQADQPVEIRLAPMVRVHARVESADPKYPVKMTSVGIRAGADGPNLGEGMMVDIELIKAQKPLPPAEYAVLVPPGRYVFQSTEPTHPNNHTGIAYYVTAKADQPGMDLDLKAIKLPINPLLKAEDAPALQISDARGVSKDVKLTDYRGRWVVLELWAHWCGPCVARGIPHLVQFNEDHAADRDKFVILTVHSSEDARDFAYIDRKLEPTIKSLWDGQPLPFPVVIDDKGKTVAAYGIEGIPATIVINPEGRIVPEGLYALNKALPPIPMDVRVARALDRPIGQGMMSGTSEGIGVGELLANLTMGQIDVAPEQGDWTKLGVTPETRVPISLMGPVTLRSALRLILEPLGLATRLGPEGLVLIKKPSAPVDPAPAPTAAQSRAAARTQTVLADNVTFGYQDKPLAEAIDGISGGYNVPILLDPAERMSGKLDPKQPISVEFRDVPLRTALQTLAERAGLTVELRDEVVLLRRQP